MGWLEKYGEPSDNTRVAPKVIPLSKKQIEQNAILNAKQRSNDLAYTQSILSDRKKARETKGSIKEHNFNIGEKLRLFPNSTGAGEFIDDYLNPVKFVGDLASNIGNSKTPKQLATNLAITAGLGAIGFDPVGQAKPIAKGVSKIPRKVLNAVDKHSEIGKKLAAIEQEGLANNLSKHEIKKLQMEQVGITSNQREAYVPIVSDFLDKYVTPYGYAGTESGLKGTKLYQTVDNILNGGHNLLKEGDFQPRVDSWKLYLGKPQEGNTFRVAETAPVNHSSYSANELKDMDIYSINSSSITDKIKNNNLGYEAEINLLKGGIEGDAEGKIMGGYNKRVNEWGLQYNDIWDLDVPIRLGNILPRKITDTKLGEKIFFKKTENGLIPKKVVVSVDDFIGKPFMSHEVLADADKEFYKNKIKRNLNKEIERQLKYSDINNLDYVTNRIREIKDNLKQLETISPTKGFIPPPTQEITRGPIDWVDAVNKEANPGYGAVNGRAYENQMKSPYVPPITGKGAPFLKKENGGKILDDGGDPTLVKDKKAGSLVNVVGSLSATPIIYNFKNNVKEVYKPGCPKGVGCSEQATDYAQTITKLPRASYAPSDAGYRDATANLIGMKNIFDQEGSQKVKANSNDKGWKYPTGEDFKNWRAGDIVTLDAGNDVYFPYDAPKGMTSKNNSGVTHNGVIMGFGGEDGMPIIKHGFASGPNKGVSKEEKLSKDGRLESLGHGRYAIKSVWRPKEVNDDDKIVKSRPVIEKATDIAEGLKSTTSNKSFYLKSDAKPISPIQEFSGANNRRQTKENLIKNFNNKELDKELQYKLGVSAQDLNNLKPVVYGLFGQESNFNDVDNPKRSLKEVIGNFIGGNSRGGAQIKFSSLTPEERKIIGLTKESQLDNDDMAYKAAMVMLINSKKRMDSRVEKGIHPNLAGKDEFFRAAYDYNSPRLARDSNSKLSMDKKSYPDKLMHQAKDLGVHIDFNGVENLTPVTVHSVIKGSKKTKFVEKENGGWLNKYK